MSKAKLTVPAPPKAQKAPARVIPALPRAAALKTNTLVVPRPPLPKRR